MAFENIHCAEAQRRLMSDFCNKIGPKPKHRKLVPLSAPEGDSGPDLITKNLSGFDPHPSSAAKQIA